MRIVIAISLVFLLVSCTQRIYIVRHAEKAVPSTGVMMNASDPPLSETGERRAKALAIQMSHRKIQHIYSTNTIRTRSTAEGVSQAAGVPVQLYNTRDSLPYFINSIKALKKGNILIVGHSNTVDDLVNDISGEKYVPGDLKDDEYSNLFILKRKGKGYAFERKTFEPPVVEKKP